MVRPIVCVLFCAACVAPPAERQQPIVGGTIDHGDPAVLMMRAQTDEFVGVGEGIAEDYCSGTLIAPTVVLTAGHCTAAALQSNAPLSVLTGHGTDHIDEVIGARAVTHPGYDPTTLANDVGILLLDHPLCKPTSPLPFQRTPLDPPPVGTPLRVVGYGEAQYGDGLPLEKRTATMTLTSFDDVTIVSADMENGICRGDSGGPALATIGGVETIVGVTSSSDRYCRERSRFIRVDAVVDFVEPFVSASPSPGPDWCASSGGCNTTPGHADGALVILLIVGVLSLRRRRRRWRAGGRSW